MTIVQLKNSKNKAHTSSSSEKDTDIDVCHRIISGSFFSMKKERNFPVNFLVLIKKFKFKYVYMMYVVNQRKKKQTDTEKRMKCLFFSKRLSVWFIAIIFISLSQSSSSSSSYGDFYEINTKCVCVCVR